MKRACLIWMLLGLGLTAGVMAELVFGAPKDGGIAGIVTEINSGAGIESATITILGDGRQVRSDRNGRFTISGLTPGSYDISVSHPSFETAEVHDIRVSAARTTEITVSLVRKERQERGDSAAQSGDYKSKAPDISTAIPNIAADESASAKRAPQSSAGQHDSEPQKTYRDNYQGSTDYLRQVPTEPRQKSYEFEQPYYSLPDDMFFRDYGTHNFVDTRRDHLSTFGLDVDDASYTLARTYLFDGNLPPTDAIRVEEFVNYFDYGYASPSESKFRVFTELTGSPFDKRTSILKIGIKGREIADWERKPLNLTLVVDVSGSMNYGNRIDLVKKSIRMLIEQLDHNDRVGIVAYGSKAFTVLEPVFADKKRQIINSLDRLHPGGSTYAEAGLKLGFQMANNQYVNGHNNLVVLCSDGVANVGKTDPDAIMRDIKQHVRKGITLSTFGFGMGNFNDVLLERLAINGNGKYAYVDTEDQARKLFVDGLVGTLQVLARDVKVQVDFNPQVVAQYRLIGYENRAIADQKFRDNRQDGGEVGAGHEVTALYEVILKQRKPSQKLATVFVRWKDADQSEVVELAKDVTAGQGYARFESARPELRLAIVAARFAEMLKQTEQSSRTSYSELARLARAVQRQMPNEQTAELVDLIDRASSLSGYLSGYDNGYDNDRDNNYGNYKD
jgi:Ca-activated chloride channel family protein